MNEQKKYLRVIEAVVGCSVKKVFLKISHNIQEITCARVSFFNKVAGLRAATLLKKRLLHMCFPVYFTKFVRTPFYQNTKAVLRENCPVTEFFLVRIFLYSDQKKLRIWTLFT